MKSDPEYASLHNADVLQQHGGKQNVFMCTLNVASSVLFKSVFLLTNVKKTYAMYIGTFLVWRCKARPIQRPVVPRKLCTVM